ncbi:MAG: roadblock/LC7 domain-containing protein [Candidatus Heimdallarchaeota archaeon]|nr:roadblock/LC7 domain-containing protein [Candidatus Heimdallarchaeota archaeon]MCK5144649.1 roadblock/LC7 domain-containing protein [Candidatus Heimdallarchaeota archaeon]
MIQAVYIISRTGVPLYFKERMPEEDDVTKITLFSGVISAIRAVLIELDAGEANYFTTRTHEVYIEATSNFALALVKDIKDKFESETVEEMIAEAITQITFNFEELPEAGILNSEEEEKMTNIIDNLMIKWDESVKDSAALKKIKESFW